MARPLVGSVPNGVGQNHGRKDDGPRELGDSARFRLDSAKLDNAGLEALQRAHKLIAPNHFAPFASSARTASTSA